MCFECEIFFLAIFTIGYVRGQCQVYICQVSQASKVLNGQTEKRKQTSE